MKKKVEIILRSVQRNEEEENETELRTEGVYEHDGKTGRFPMKNRKQPALRTPLRKSLEQRDGAFPLYGVVRQIPT